MQFTDYELNTSASSCSCKCKYQQSTSRHECGPTLSVLASMVLCCVTSGRLMGRPPNDWWYDTLRVAGNRQSYSPGLVYTQTKPQRHHLTTWQWHRQMKWHQRSI